ncbi:MAG: phosphatase PAP2 family protein, partial [Actinomycetia bacterium]|nr:phosphatase PAP2 family protein [Actinomycetes bacterium]
MLQASRGFGASINAGGIQWWRAALALVLLIPAKLIVERDVLKALVDRERPAASICGGDLSCGHFRNVPLAFDSYPSGHAVLAGAMVVILLPYTSGRGATCWPRWVGRSPGPRLPRGAQPAGCGRRLCCRRGGR